MYYVPESFFSTSKFFTLYENDKSTVDNISLT